MNDNYMKTILSGVKEWTENLTDDAKDKANNALDKANKSIDKALYVVNLTQNSDGTYSADKTFAEITQAYNEGKYSIVLKYGFEEGEVFEYSFLRLDEINPAWAHFISPYHMGAFDNIGVVTVFIYKNNTIKLTDTELAKIPSPFPLTFTGAVNETYDGSSAKTIEIPSGGGGAHSDWNQNDSTAADYIKNRPFYMGDPVEMVLVEESSVPFTDSNHGFYVAQIQSNFAPTVGETYKVSWDSTVYECNCVDFSGNLFIGNLSIAGAGSDTGEPFLMGVNDGGAEIYTLDTSASHTISISGFVAEVVKIADKYLPEYSVLYRGNPTDWSDAKKQQMYNDFISGKLVLYQDSVSGFGVVLSVWYGRTIGLNFIFFENRQLKIFTGNDFLEGVDLSEFGINELIKNYINTLTRWKIYAASASEVSVGDLLSAYVEFDSTTNKACILTNIKTNIVGVSKAKKSTIVTNGDSDVTLSSSTAGSTKKFKITVDDSGTITATEVV